MFEAEGVALEDDMMKVSETDGKRYLSFVIWEMYNQFLLGYNKYYYTYDVMKMF